MNDICYSLNDEEFIFDDFGDMIDNMIDPKVGDVYYEADCKSVSVEDYLDVDQILESADERLYDDVGEIADPDYFAVGAEARAELKNLLDEWARKHVSLRYWKIVGKSRAKEIEEGDLS